MYCVIVKRYRISPIRIQLTNLWDFSSQSDWEHVWHQEKHSRCRDKLVRQLYWACEKDIYRLTRRNRKRAGAGNDLWLVGKGQENRKLQYQKYTYNPIFPLYLITLPLAAPGSAASTWLHVNYANMLLRSRRTDAPSITNECCTKVGCTWEEYAEYCPSNKRRNHY